MKKTVGLFILTTIAVVLVACKDKCVQEWSPTDAPALSQHTYNSCETLFCNFYYSSVDNKDYPYFSYEGDTILCSGYVKRIYYTENRTWVQFSMGDDSLSNYGRIWVESDSLYLTGIDISQKCFVKGTLSFGKNTSHFTWIDYLQPGACLSPEILLNLTEIRN